MKTNFESYLKSKGYSFATIKTFVTNTRYFLEWLTKQNVNPEDVRQADILDYMKHSRKESISQRTVQHRVIMLRHYFDHLIEQKEMEQNPAAEIKVQGVKRKTLHRILEAPELNALYNSYEAATLSEKRNKVILGLLVYQGLKSEDLFRLQVKDVKLREGKIEVPGSKRTNGRTLQLEPHQVMDVYDYVMNVRPEILRQSKEQTDHLFVGLTGGKSQSHFIQNVLKQLRPAHAKLKNPDQLRASVIVKWLKQYNLREVQYLAGHRYISSTEAYKQNEMEGLSEEVNLYHPLG